MNPKRLVGMILAITVMLAVTGCGNAAAPANSGNTVEQEPTQKEVISIDSAKPAETGVVRGGTLQYQFLGRL